MAGVGRGAALPPTILAWAEPRVESAADRFLARAVAPARPAGKGPERSDRTGAARSEAGYNFQGTVTGRQVRPFGGRGFARARRRSVNQAALDMIKTFGLTHVNLAVRDVERSVRFYHHVFGMEEYSRGAGLVHMRTPGAHDVVTFDVQGADAGRAGGVAHFGFRLISPDDIDAAVEAVQQAGGRLLRRGEFSPGYPYAYVADPDGYEVEIWYE